MFRRRKEIHKSEGRLFRAFALFLEAIGWLQIVASPFLIGLAIGGIIYFTDPSPFRLVIGIAVATIGLIVGIIWATKQWKGKGTNWFMSRVMATPDMDNPETDENTGEKTS